MPASDPSSKVRFGEFELDVTGFELRRRGRPVHLGRQPMDVLILLVERQGQLVSRAEIIDRLWGKDVFVDVDTGVNTAISKIRQALRDSAETPAFVETVPGRGYRFLAQAAPTEAPPAAQTAATPASVPVAAPEAVVNRRLVAGIAIAAAAVAATVAAFWIGGETRFRPGVSIAVLPFVNLGDNPEHQYLADGLTDETAALLAQIDPEHLSVKGRTLRYKGTQKTVAEIGRELVVDYLVDSSMLVEGTRVRVTAKLIRVRDEEYVWSQSFEREPTSLLGFQQELSTAIAEQVRLRVPSDRAGGFSQRQTRNPEAYDAYLRGRHFQNRRTPDATRRAIPLFERAVTLDPDYALAWSALAFTYAAGTINSDARPMDAWPLARQATAQAVRANPNLAESQLAVGYVDWLLAWDWKRAEAASREAARLDPSNAVAFRPLGHALSQQGRHAEAEVEMRRARQLDPADAMHVAISSQVSFQARDFPAALTYARDAVRLDPTLWIGYVQMGQAYRAARAERPGTRSAEPMRPACREATARPSHFGASSLARTGRTAAAQEVLKSLEAAATRSLRAAEHLRRLHAGLGDADAVFEWLDKAFAARDVHLIFLPVDAKWDAYRQRPAIRGAARTLRFRAMIRGWRFLSIRRSSRCSPSSPTELPAGDAFLYEPKWDGFRAIVFRGGGRRVHPEPRPAAARSLLSRAARRAAGRAAGRLRRSTARS